MIERKWRCRVNLFGILPPIWRVIDVQPHISLHHLNLVFQIAFGWGYPSGDYEFHIGRKRIRERDLYIDAEARIPRAVPLSSLLQGLPGERFSYVRAGESSWAYDVELTEVIQTDASQPQCPEGEGAMPADGFGGNADFGRFLSGQRDASASVRDFYKEWAEDAKGSSYWFNDFDLFDVNERLRDLNTFEE